MVEMKFKVHTVILMVGPSGCGKSTLSKLIKEKMAHAFKTPWRDFTNIQYIGSDELRKDLLGSSDLNYLNHSHQLMAASEQAFDLLYKKLELVTSYPINAELVIVDTTGLNSEFRHKIATMAESANYHTCCILFDYKDRDDYYKYIRETHDLALVSSHIKRLRQDTMGVIKKRSYDKFYTIKKKDFSDFSFSFEDSDLYQTHYLPRHLEYSMIGDIHGSYSELIALLTDLRFVIVDGLIVEKPTYKVPIILGDYIDGPDMGGVENVIKFLYANKEHFKFVRGNHENFVFKYCKGLIKKSDQPPATLVTDLFPTTRLFEKNTELAAQFYELFDLSKDFYIGYNFIVTHSPCEDRYLGKLKTLKEQRNYRYPQREDDESLDAYTLRLENSLGFLTKSAATNKPYHIFGHCSVHCPIRVKNKIGVDTGAAQGYFLTSVTVVGEQLFFKSVTSTRSKTEDLPILFKRRKDAATEVLSNVDLSELDPKELKRIELAARDKINYISGTMSPANKDIEAGSLESMAKALEYFKEHQVDTLCIQKKYMGSRAELFLNCLDVTKSYTSTRRGYLVRLDLTQAYEKVLAKVGAWARENDYEWLLLDCELMPWYALGKGLIESQYKPCKFGIESEIQLLEETGFEAYLEKLRKEYDADEYAKLSSQLSKEKLREQISSHKCANYEAIRHQNWIPLAQQAEYLKTYSRQLEVFASPSDTIEFKPFAILKGIRQDGTEDLFFHIPNSEQFATVSDDDYAVIDLTQDDALDKANRFFESVLSHEMEGVVVKPDLPYIKGVAPYLKVRSPLYLHIIYGMDYTYEPKYQKLLRQKRIDGKLRTSIDEYEYGKRMLEIPRSEISKDNQDYVNLVAKLILEEKREEKFDPRL